MNPTMQTIANQLGMSKSTISLAMRDDPRIAPRTRAKVHQTARSMGYQVRPELCRLMAALRIGGRKTGERIALVLPAGCEPSREFLAGLNERLAVSGFDVEPFRLADVTAERLATIVRARGIDASLVVGSEHATTVLAGAGQYCVFLRSEPDQHADGFLCGILIVDQLSYHRQTVIRVA